MRIYTDCYKALLVDALKNHQKKINKCWNISLMFTLFAVALHLKRLILGLGGSVCKDGAFFFTGKDTFPGIDPPKKQTGREDKSTKAKIILLFYLKIFPL